MSRSLRPKAGTLPSKIQDGHLERLAIVYVRQSTLQQLEHHRESTRVQYALADRACLLGWARPRVIVIDDDLGCSGASAAQRPGFQRLVAEVGLGHVGLVLGFEVSRLARSCRDWYHLLEICALAGTLIADNDGVYDPTSRYPYPAEECSARAGNGHRSGASALWADVRARLADKGTRPGQLRPGCLPRRHHAEDPDRGDEPAAGRTEHACEQAHAPRHPGAGTPRHPGRTA